MKAKQTVRLAIIGTGAMAGAHADQYKKIAGCVLVAACDVDAARARAFSDQHGIPQAFSDSAELLADADLLGAAEQTRIEQQLQATQLAAAGQDIEAVRKAIKALSAATDDFAASRMDRIIRMALTGKSLDDVGR